MLFWPGYEKGDRGNLFEKTARASLIPWNGSGAINFIPGQPQRKISFAAEVFSACTVPPGSGMGAFYVSRCISGLRTSQRDPNGPQPTISKRQIDTKFFFRAKIRPGLRKYLHRFIFLKIFLS